jgi:hypothetical protein
MASNLPPGVTVGMLPGNRPEDIAMDKVIDWICDQDLTPWQVQEAIRVHCESNRIKIHGALPLSEDRF